MAWDYTHEFRDGPGNVASGEAVMDNFRDAKAQLDAVEVAAVIPGEIKMYAGAVAPGGFLLCDGTAVSRATYAALFAVVGERYGRGDGSTTFNLPDYRGRSAVGADPGGATGRLPSFWELGQSAGASTHRLTDAEMPSHSHNMGIGTAVLGVGAADEEFIATVGPGSLSTRLTGSGAEHNNMPPYQTANFIVKT